jgi:hypothetical protein
MYQADNAVMQGRGWAVGAWTILVMATVLGLLSGQASQMIGEHFPFGAAALGSDARAAVWPVGGGGARHEALPIILTIPLAVTRTQRMMVARVKHQGEADEHAGRIRRGIRSTRGLLAGLALMGASQPQGR